MQGVELIRAKLQLLNGDIRKSIVEVRILKWVILLIVSISVISVIISIR